MGATNQEVDLCACTKHGSSTILANRGGGKKMGARLFENSAFLNKTVGAVKNVSNTIKTTTQQAATQVKQTVKKQRDPKLAERFEKRLTDELHKIFDDSDSFYYSRTLDLTNSLQRQYEIEKVLETEEGNGKPITDITRWWNLILATDKDALLSDLVFRWDVAYKRIRGITTILPNRYNRRGIEPSGKVANYVETEQIVSIICSDSIHRASFVQVRGSVPIFWSQPDYKFRPPPRLDRTEEESHTAFKKHFEDELKMYKQVCIVNLVEQQGRERIIWEAYSNHVLKYNNPDIIYATFDFHEYCRGMHYENVSILINAIADIIGEMRFCWRDNRGLICTQNGVFRVNCIDCLDRTNVVQTAIAKYVLELQLCRLGLGTPGCGLPPSLRQAFLTMWADSGDLVSRQYAGTKALKGDYTRTGERKLTGMMKDGVASANRYYLSTFKDALRQVAIDVMTGESRCIPEQLIVPDGTRCTSVKVLMMNDQSVPDTAAMAQHVKSLIDDCKKLLVDTEPVLGSWGLIDADPQ
ncbi:jg4850 [Pararge aegeria aegeria]|uniref:Jg4850 protein n=1 Tax=Pararge aegeria aegeria TaxID=348720 RepID=A0A8S4S655_9NEOP|nr:jg4850 [Pararge aegeria aegeria]